MIHLPKFVLVVCAGLLAACSPQAADSEAMATPAPQLTTAGESAARHPVSGLELLPLTVTTANGTAHAFTVEIAASSEEQTRGLMFRTEMAANEGMLFPREDDPRESSFWMRNTVLPLDIIYIGTDRTILNIAANAVPYSLESLPSAGVAGAVLEINGGLAAELGIAAGDSVDW